MSERHEEIEADILYEDNHLIAINKPAGVLVQGDETGDMPLVEYVRDYLRATYKKPGNVFCGVIHRLDRPVSGVVLFAKTSKALERMNELFRTREIKKTYWAAVSENPPQESATLIHWLKKDQTTNTVKAYEKEVRTADRAELSFSVYSRIGRHFLLEVLPVTGKPHQIRAQLAKMGCPIQGDVKYGAPEGNRDKSICLHARKLSFIHPVKKEPIEIVAELPHGTEWQRWRDVK